MDGVIRGIPTIHGPRGIGQNRQSGQRRRGGFEETLKGKDSAGVGPELDEAPESASGSGLDPVPKPLQDRRPPGRRNDEGRSHIDVLA